MKKTEFEYKIKDEGVLQSIEQLNELGKEGWKISTVFKNKVIFIRTIEETLTEKEETYRKEKFAMT